MKVVLAGAGAFGTKHLDGVEKIDGVSVIGLVGRRLEPTREVAGQYGIEHVFTDLSEALKLQEVEGACRRHAPRGPARQKGLRRQPERRHEDHCGKDLGVRQNPGR